MRVSTQAIASAAVLFMAAAPAPAQQLPVRLGVGDQVRIQSPDRREGLVRARVQVLEEDGWITVQGLTHGDLWSHRLVANDLLAVWRRRPPIERMARGGRLGAFIGGSAAGVAAPLIAARRESVELDWMLAGTGAVAGALLGGGLGAVIGRAVPQYQWVYFRVPAVR